MRKPSLKINALSNWAALVVHTAIAFVLTPFIVRTLGKTDYGIWTLVVSLAGYYGLLNLGVGSAMTRYIARYTAQKDSDSLNEVASTALVMFTLTGALAVLLSFVLAPVLADFFQVGEAERTAFTRVIRILGLATGLGFPNAVFGAIISAREHFVAKNIVGCSQELIRAGLTTGLVMAGWGLVGIGLAMLVSAVVGIVCNVILMRVFGRDIELRPSHAHTKTLRMLLVYGGTTTVIAVADIIRGNLDSFVIAKWVGLSSVGIYGIAATLRRYVGRLVASGMGVVTPRYAALDGKGDEAGLQRLMLRALAISSFLSFGSCMLLIVLGKQFILWWVGDEYSEAAVILWILCTGSAFALAQNPAIGFMYGLNKHYLYAAATIVEAIANLGISLTLVHRYGIVGVALGTLIPMLIVKILVMPLYAARIAKLSLRRYLAPMVPPGIIGMALVALGYCLGIVTKQPAGLHTMLIEGLAFGTCYVVVWCLVTRILNPRLLSELMPRAVGRVLRVADAKEGAI